VARKALAKETYDALLPQLNAVADNYAAVLAEIATYPTEAAKAVATGEDSQAIADGIEAVKQALAQELAAATLSNEDGAWTDKINALQTQVDALAEKAKDTNVAAIYGDSKVSIIEYTNMVDIILEKTPAPAADSIEFLKYDVNGDGVINSSDIRPMVELIIEQNKVKN
jgi:glycine/D-amino acid oxidase-like deaminating enzyme